MAELGLSPSFLIGHVHYWGKAFVDDIFGPEKAAKLDRTGACEDLGIRWTIHSDDPVTEMNPLRCMENAVTRTMWRSDQLLSPEERVPAAAALRALVSIEHLPRSTTATAPCEVVARGAAFAPHCEFGYSSSALP